MQTQKVSDDKPKVLFILGPTGVGKTSLAVSFAKEFNGEIISADSVQVFKEFDIGSAKITADEMEGVVHYGIDIVSPSEEFSACTFVEYTKEKINKISSNGKLPIIVGGTALYVKSLVEGYNFGGAEKHEDYRRGLEEEIEKNGLEKVFARLTKEAPDVASKIDGKNKVRVIRTFEILKYGKGKQKDQTAVEYDYKIFALTMPRENLYEKINKRAKIMIEKGLVKEVENLYSKYGDCQPMRAIGYKEVVAYLKGEISIQQMESLVSQHTRNYAKRQLTFLRSMQNVNMVDVTKHEELLKMKEEIKTWLKKRI